MKNEFYIKGFTVQELLIGLLISSIIISMVYVILTLFSRQMVSHINNSNSIMEFNQFRQVLSKDIFLSQDIELKNDELKIRYAKKTFKYSFRNNKVVRLLGSNQSEFTVRTDKPVITELNKGKYSYKIFKLNVYILNDTIILFESKRNPVDKEINKLLFQNEY